MTVIQLIGNIALGVVVLLVVASVIQIVGALASMARDNAG